MSKEIIDNLTIEELEILSRAYLECRLSKIQEKELQLVLASVDFSSPVIQEARETMGIISEWEAMKPIPRIRRKPEFKVLRWCAAAACVIVLIGVAVRLNTSVGLINNVSEDSGITVWVDGRCLSEDEARKIAGEDQAICMARMEQSLRLAGEEQNECMKEINAKLNIQ